MPMADDWADMGTLETALSQDPTFKGRKLLKQPAHRFQLSVRVLIGLALAYYVWSKTLRKFNQISSEQRDYIFMKWCAACEHQSKKDQKQVESFILDWKSTNTKHLGLADHEEYLQMHYLQAGMG